MLFRVGLRDLLILCAFGAVWGGIWASFLCCMAWRLPRGVPLSKSSYCPSCGHRLLPPDLVPVFSWLLLGGRCRYCGAKIPAGHAAAEIAFAAASVLCLLQYGITVLMVRNWLFLCCLLWIALSDWDSEIISADLPCGIGLAVWLGSSFFTGTTMREAVVVLLQCVLVFAVGDLLLQFPIALFAFGPFQGFGYHTVCAAVLSLAALYLRPLPALLSLGLACALLFLLRLALRVERGGTARCGSMAGMMAVSSAAILLLGI